MNTVLISCSRPRPSGRLTFLFALGLVAQQLFSSSSPNSSSLLKVLLKAVDNHETVVLILLDLSAAFDRLIVVFQSRFGIKGKALQWFRSYLANRLQ